MQSISIHRYWKTVFVIVLVLFFLIEYFGMVVVVLLFILVDCPLEVRFLMIVALAVGVAMVPLWYRTFFDRRSPGLEATYAVRWSANEITFAGRFFEIRIPPERVLAYSVIGFKGLEGLFWLKLRVLKDGGNVQSLYLSSGMPEKRRFLRFLEEQKAKRSSPAKPSQNSRFV